MSDLQHTGSHQLGCDRSHQKGELLNFDPHPAALSNAARELARTAAGAQTVLPGSPHVLHGCSAPKGHNNEARPPAHEAHGILGRLVHDLHMAGSQHRTSVVMLADAQVALMQYSASRVFVHAIWQHVAWQPCCYSMQSMTQQVK